LRASPAKNFGRNYKSDHQYEHKLNFIYNFESQSWVRIIDLPDDMGPYFKVPADDKSL